MMAKGFALPSAVASGGSAAVGRFFNNRKAGVNRIIDNVNVMTGKADDFNVIQNEINLEKSDWKDIAAIIDDALDEVKEYEFDLTQTPTKPYNLVLSNFHINELRPLLEKFDQTIIQLHHFFYQSGSVQNEY
jgi:hypothetical protein